MAEKMQCQFCSLDFTSAYKIVPHIYFGHRKKIVRLSREKCEIKLMCPTGGDCGFNKTSKISKGTPKEQLFEIFSTSLNDLLDHIRSGHTHEAKIDECPYCHKNLDNIIYWEHLEEHMNNTAQGSKVTSPPPTVATSKPSTSPISNTASVSSNMDVKPDKIAASTSERNVLTPPTPTIKSMPSLISPPAKPPPAGLSPGERPMPLVMSPQGQPPPPVVSPAGKPPSPVVSPAGKPSPPVVSPAGKPSPPVVSPAGKPSPPVVSPADKPSPPVVSPTDKPSPPVVSPTDKPSPPVVSPAGKQPPPVVSPAGKQPPPVVSPTGKPLPPVVSPSGKPSPAVVSPAGKPPPPVVSPAGKPPPPVMSPAGKPSPPGVSPVGKPSPRVLSPSSKLLASKISPSVAASPPVESSAAKSRPPVESPPHEPSLSLVSTATKSPTMISSTSTKSQTPSVSPATKSQVNLPFTKTPELAKKSLNMAKSCDEAEGSKSPPTLAKYSSKSFSPGNEPKKRSSKSSTRNESSKTSSLKSKSPLLELESPSSALPLATPQHSAESEEPFTDSKQSTKISPTITEPQFPSQKHQTKSSSSKVKQSKSKRVEVTSEAKESQFDREAQLNLESPSPEVSGSHTIPDAVINPVAAADDPVTAIPASPLPSIASITATTLSSPMESSPLAGSSLDSASICTPPSINFVRDNKPTLATVVTNISRISNSKETSLNTKQPDVQNISPLLSIDAMSPELVNEKESIDIPNTDILSKCIESSTVSNLKTTESKPMVTKQQDKDENYVGSNKTVKIPIVEEKLVSPEIQLTAFEASASEISGKQCHTFSVVVTPNAEPESPVIVENQEKRHDVDLVARLSEKDTKESSLSPGMDSLERSSSNTPLQDEKVFSQSDVSMSQTPVSPSARSPREKNIDKDEETDLEKELEKLKALKEKIHPPPPKILPPKAVSRRKTSRDEPKMAPKKPLLTEEMEREIIYGNFKSKSKTFRPAKSEEKTALSREEKLSAVRKEIEAVFHKEEERSQKEKADKRKKEREEREKLKREQASKEKRRISIEREQELRKSNEHECDSEQGTSKESRKQRQRNRAKEKFENSTEERFKGDDHMEVKLKEHFVGLGYGDDSSSPSPPPSPRQRSSHKSTSHHVSPPPNPPSPPRTPPPPKMSPQPTQYPLTPPPPKISRTTSELSPAPALKPVAHPQEELVPRAQMTKLKSPSPSVKHENIVTTGFEEKGWIEDRELGGSAVVAWRGGKKLDIGGDSMALIRDTYGDDDVCSPVKEVVEPPKKTIPKGFDELGRPLNDPMEIAARPVPINPVLVKAANNAARGIMGPARAEAGGDADPQLMCSLCKEDGQSAPYFSAYQLLSHVFLAHRKKIVSRSRKNRGMILACPDGCGFVTGRSSAGVSIEYYNGQLPVHLHQLSEHIRVQHTGEERMVTCQFCHFPLEHREAWSWQHLANHRDSRRRYCEACNTFPFLNEVHKCTGENKPNQLPPPVSVMGDPMPSQMKADSKFGKYQRFTPMEGKRATTTAKETSLERLARQLETGQLDASLLEGSHVVGLGGIGKPKLMSEVERFDCVMCSSYWPKAGAWVSHMRQEHLGKGELKNSEQLCCWCCSWVPAAWQTCHKGGDVLAVAQLVNHVAAKHGGEGWQENDWQEEAQKIEKLERQVVRQREREKEEASIEIPDMPAECDKCGDVLEDADKYKRHFLGHKYGEVFCATCHQWILAHFFSDHSKVCNEEEMKRIKVNVMKNTSETWFEILGKKIKVVFDFHESEEQGAAAVARCEVKGEQLSGVGGTIEAATKALQEEVIEHLAALNEDESKEMEIEKQRDVEALLEMFEYLAAVDAGKGNKYFLEVAGNRFPVKTGWRLEDKGEHSIVTSCHIKGKEVIGEGQNVEKSLKKLKKNVAVEWNKTFKCEKCGSEFSKQVCFEMHRMVNCVR